MKFIDRAFFCWVLLTIAVLLTSCGYGEDGATNPEPPSPKVGASRPTLNHHIKLTPNLQTGILSVENHLRFSGGSGKGFDFTLNKAFTVKGSPEITTRTSPAPHTDNWQAYHSSSNALVLNYNGKLEPTPDCNWLAEACVMFSAQGIFLDANSGWYPQAEGALHTFELEISLPTGWVSLSQGTQTASGWAEQQPQQAIYLLAGEFTAYSEPGQHATAMVYLRNADEALAKRYLQATHRYLAEYSALLGDYPYAKFATVESFWETGWGMPSFTLLGPKVMRLPFILHSSFPHEILHNWWGNSVYIDPSHGNWAEGLTAYQADYRIREASGEGMNYRRDTLQKYTTFAATGGDFPLQNFRSRHDQATQAVGYGKGLMLFHALRQRLGGDIFISGLRQFYRDFQFRPASFDDLRTSLETVSGQSLQPFFTQWLQRSGAPGLSIGGHGLSKDGTGSTLLDITLRQTSPDAPFQLQIPLKAAFADGSQTTQWLDMDKAEQHFQLEYPQPPEQVAVDPGFDVFRIPAQDEMPPALDVLFSRQPKTFVLARQVPAGMELAWEEVVDALSYGQPDMKRQYDDDPLPETGTVVLLGGDNAALTALLERAKQPFRLNETAYTLNSVNYSCGLHSLALALQAGKQQLILLDANTPEALQTLANKIPHYGKYSYVLFNSATGENVAKGQWEVTDSPLVVRLGE